MMNAALRGMKPLDVGWKARIAAKIVRLRSARSRDFIHDLEHLRSESMTHWNMACMFLPGIVRASRGSRKPFSRCAHLHWKRTALRVRGRVSGQRLIHSLGASFDPPYFLASVADSPIVA